MAQSENVKSHLWDAFTSSHGIAETCVPLFDVTGGYVTAMPYGKNNRLILKRSAEMESLMRGIGRQLIKEHRGSRVVHDGILYLMLRRDGDRVVPLYIGKAEIFGKGQGNLSANISDLDKGDGKFGRWGYNYAYHIGDLSAVALPGHPHDKKRPKYEMWRDALFDIEASRVSPKFEIRFWAALWGADSLSVWQDYGRTKLAFEEYLLIGVASDVFPAELLNLEGRTRAKP